MVLAQGKGKGGKTRTHLVNFVVDKDVRRCEKAGDLAKRYATKHDM